MAAEKEAISRTVPLQTWQSQHLGNQHVSTIAFDQARHPGPAEAEAVARRSIRSAQQNRAAKPAIDGHATRLSGRDSRLPAVKRKADTKRLIHRDAVHKKQHAAIMRLQATVEGKERMVRGLRVQWAKWILDDKTPAEGGQKEAQTAASANPGLAEEQPGLAVLSRKADTLHASAPYTADAYAMALFHSIPLPYEVEKRHRLQGRRSRSVSCLDALLEEFQHNLQVLDESRYFLRHQFDVSMAEVHKPTMAAMDALDQTDLKSLFDTPTDMEIKLSETDSDTDTLNESSPESQDDLKTTRKQVDDLKKTNNRLEQSLRTAKEKEFKLRGSLRKLNESKTRTERRLQEATDGKENLENEARALSTLNVRLAGELHKHHGNFALIDTNANNPDETGKTLRDERDALQRELDKAKSDITSLQHLDSKRKEQLDGMMQQAASVENHLLTALERLEILSAEYSQRRSSRRSSTILAEDSSELVSLTDTRLKAVEETVHEQQSRIDSLEEKEKELMKEIGDLEWANETTEKELDSAHTELTQLRKSMQQLNNDLESTRNQAFAARRSAEQAYQYNQILEEDLTQTQKASNRTNQKLKIISVKLVASSKENGKLSSQLARSESALDISLEENSRLNGMIESLGGSLNAAEESVATLSLEFKTFVQESEGKLQQMEEERLSVEAAKDIAEERLCHYEQETRGIVDVNVSLQHVLNAFAPKSVASAPLVSGSSPGSTSSQEPIIEEGGEFVDELSLLQDNISKIHGVLSRVRISKDLGRIRGHSKQDSGIAMSSSSSILSRRSSRRSVAESPLRQAVGNFSRHSTRDTSHIVSRDASPAASMIHSSKRAVNRPVSFASTWSSSDSTLAAGNRSTTPTNHRGSGPDHVVDDHELIDEIVEEAAEELNEVEVVADGEMTAEAVEEELPDPMIRVQNSIERSKMQFRSDPNLRRVYDRVRESISNQEHSAVFDPDHTNSMYVPPSNRLSTWRSMDNMRSTEDKVDLSSPSKLAEFSFTASEAYDLGTSPPSPAVGIGMAKSKLRMVAAGANAEYPASIRLSQVPRVKSIYETANSRFVNDLGALDAPGPEWADNLLLPTPEVRKQSKLPEYRKKSPSPIEPKKNRRTMLLGSGRRSEDKNMMQTGNVKRLLGKLMGK